MKGIPQRISRPHRFDYHVISIGKKDYKSYRSITEQLKFGALIPPSLNSIKSMQRKFLGNIRRMITDTIINNQDVCKNAIQPKPKKVTATTTIDCNANGCVESPEKPNDSSPAKASTSIITTDNTVMPTPSPTKKAHISPGTNVKSKFGLVEELFGQEYAEIPTEALDRLIMQCVELKQSRTGNSHVLNNKNYKNGRQNYYIKVPITATQKGFNKDISWIHEVLKINGKKDSAFKSAKRTMKML